MKLTYTTTPGPTFKDYGVMVRGRSFWGEVLAKSTAGDGWSLFTLFRDHIVKRERWSVHEINMQTGEVTPHYGTMDEPSQIRAFSDGRIYVTLGSVILRLNPDTKAFDEIKIPTGHYWYWRPASDGTVYLCCADDSRILHFDPATDQVVDFGTIDQAQGGLLARMWEYGDINDDGEILFPFGVDDQSAYVVTGHLPRALWSLNFDTRDQRMLLCIADPDRMAILQREADCYALVRRPTGDELYRLSPDEATRIDSLPPHREATVPTVAGIPEPEIPERLPMPVADCQGTSMCEADGTGTAHFRPHGKDWQTATIDLTEFPSYLFQMGATADGRLLCSSEDPYTIFAFDPESGERSILGPSPYYTHTYGFAELEGKIYFTGYTGAPLFEYDPDKPWTYQAARPGGPIPIPEDPASNPRLVTRMPRMRRAYGIVAGPNQRLYLPCSAEMTGPLASGGGLGWYEPSSGRTGMIREGFEMHLGNAIITASDARYMVVPTTAWWPRHIAPEASGVPSRVVTYDVEADEILGDLEPHRDVDGGGTLVEWRPGLVVARYGTAHTREPEALFFILDVATQEIVSTHRIPGASSSRLLRLPDGNLLGHHDGGIYRLDPEKWSFEPVCKLDTAPRDWRVVNGKIYAFLDTRLVQLTNI